MNKIEELREIAEKCVWILKNKYKVKKVFLIRSLAEGYVHERSDIDLVVEGLSPDLYIKSLTEFWDVLPSGLELNVIPFEDAFESLKEKTLKEGELIYG